jgi:hypothetical protein
MRGDLLPVSADRWQHGAKICFATYLVKNQKNAKNATTTRAREKK